MKHVSQYTLTNNYSLVEECHLKYKNILKKKKILNHNVRAYFRLQ